MLAKPRMIAGMLILLVSAGQVLPGCDHSNANDPVNITAVCGNGIIEGNEMCDGQNTENRTCEDEGFSGDTSPVVCCADCSAYDTSHCTSACTDNDGDYHISEDNDSAECGTVCGPAGNEACLGNNDCNDNNASVSPGVTEICDNNIDDNCRDGADENCSSPVSCNNSYIVPASMTEVNTTTFPGIGGGDCLLIEASTRGRLTIRDIRGEAGNPVTIINFGGKVRLNANKAWVGLWLRNCEYFRLTGTGDARTEYGFEVFNSSNLGVNATDRSRYFEIDHIEVHDVDGAGIGTKTDEPIRESWTQFNTYLHHNYVHDIGTEGFYIGSSKWEQGLHPELDGVEICHNRVERTGWDGIQLASAPRNVKVHHNIAIDSGLSNEQKGGNTGFGFSVNKGTTGDWYNNYTENTRSHGMFFNGGPIGDYRIFNNIVINSGRDGIRWQTGQNGELFENTIIESAEYGIQAGLSIRGEIFDNLVVDYSQHGVSGSQAILFNNLELKDLQAAGFVDPLNNDFHITQNSPAFDAGTESRNAPYDYDDNLRPAFSKPDIGAYEFDATGP